MPAASPTYLTGLVFGHALELDPQLRGRGPDRFIASSAPTGDQNAGVLAAPLFAQRSERLSRPVERVHATQKCAEVTQRSRPVQTRARMRSARSTAPCLSSDLATTATNVICPARTP